MDRRMIVIGSAIAVFFIVCAAAAAILYGADKNDPCAEVYVNGSLYAALPLSEDRELVVKTELGTNTVRVKDGAVSVVEADCPDKVCVHTGAVSKGNVPIICLPHKLEIKVVNGKADTDAKAG